MPFRLIRSNFLKSITQEFNFQAAILVFAASLFLPACDSSPDADSTRQNVVELEVWLHPGEPHERAAIQEQVMRFNAMQYRIRVNAVILPEGSYDAQMQASSKSGRLPDMLEIDGPFVHDFITRRRIIPLDKLLTDNSRNDLLPAALRQGMYQGRLYRIETSESGVALYARAGKLREAGIRIPGGVGDAWKAGEFSHVLERLAARDPDGAVLDLALGDRGEWYSYAFAPVIQSAGSDLIDRKSFSKARGILNDAGAVSALKEVQSWIKHGYVDMNPEGDAFAAGRVALSWGDQSAYERYSKVFDSDLVVLPLPDFGRGPRTAQGSWGWAITETCRNRQAAMQFLEFLLQTEQIHALTEASHSIPATRSAIAASPLYRDGGPLHLFVSQLDSIAVPRPGIPAYPLVSTTFQHALDGIIHGADVQRTLDEAADAIDRGLAGGG